MHGEYARIKEGPLYQRRASLPSGSQGGRGAQSPEPRARGEMAVGPEPWAQARAHPSLVLACPAGPRPGLGPGRDGPRAGGGGAAEAPIGPWAHRPFIWRCCGPIIPWCGVPVGAPCCMQEVENMSLPAASGNATFRFATLSSKNPCVEVKFIGYWPTILDLEIKPDDILDVRFLTSQVGLGCTWRNS